MISNQEWHEVAERSAAAKFGAKHAGWYSFRRFWYLYAIPAVLGVVGYGIFRAWQAAHSAWQTVSMPDAPHVGTPALFWFAGVVLAVGTVAAFSMTRFSRLGVIGLTALIVLFGWGFYLVMLVGYWSS
jgi:hypothetical protein